MKKIITISALLVALILSTVPAIAAEQSQISIYIDGEKQEFENSAFLSQDTTFVPMRGVFEALGAKVDWSSERKEVTAQKDGTTLVLKIGSTSALVNNKLQAMPQAPMLVDGRTMIPLRFVSEALDAKVNWNAAEKRVDILRGPDKDGAADNDTALENLLTYEQAINLGIRKSPEYNSAVINAERAKESNNNLYLTLGTYNLGMLQAKKDLSLRDKWMEMQLGITAELVGTKIKNQMDSITMLLKEQEVLQGKIEFLKYKNRMDGLKYEIGTISKIDLTRTQAELDAALQEEVSLKTKIQGEQLKLENLTGIDATQKQIEYELNYEEIGAVDLDRKIKDDTAEDPYIWYAGQNLEVNEFRLNTYEYNVAEKSYTLTALDVSEARKNLKETKEALASVIKQRHHQLTQIEESIKGLKLQLEQAKRSTNAVRLQYDVGLATKVQLEEAQLQIPALELETAKLRQQHEQLKLSFEKPYLNPEYFSTGM